MLKKLHIFICAVLLMSLTSCYYDEIGITNLEEKAITKEMVKVHFIDVGQGDSTLIESSFGNMLIDGGDNGTEEKLINYLKENGIKKIDYIVATHPHSDHIGGLKEVVDEFDIGKIYMPKKSHTTVTFEKFIKSVSEKKIKVEAPSYNETLIMGDIEFTFLNPIREEYDNLNNYSIVMKMVYDKTSFLFSGDAEKLVENDILDKGADIKSDLYKVSHHGSSTSSSEEYVKAISPQIAVISLGKDNDYGHPHHEVIELLNKNNIKTYRTDEMGTIIFYTDGTKIALNIEDLAIEETNLVVDSLDKKYIGEDGLGTIKGNINSKGEKIYHMPEGKYYEKTKAEMYFKTEKEAMENGFRKSST